MSRKCIVVSIALVAALLACGEDEGGFDGPGPGGGSPGGSGGGDEPTICMGGVRVVELDGSATPAVIEEMLDPTDTWAGSCAPELTVGNDVLVHFRATESGYHRFSTEGSEIDTLLFALADCNDGFSELACNDDVAGGRQSRLVLDLEAGEEVYIVVDSVDVKQSAPFRLAVERVELTPPVIDEIEAFVDRVNKRTGVLARGRDPDALLAAFTMVLYDTAGNQLTAPTTLPFAKVDYMEVEEHDGSFVVRGGFVLGNPPILIGALDFAVIDENGLSSEMVHVETRDPPTVGRGEACDPEGLFSRCGPGDVCRAPAEGAEGVCIEATPPSITLATASKNLVASTWGLVITGADAQNDIVGARVFPKNADGQALPVSRSGRTVLPFHHTATVDGVFRGVVAVSAVFDGPCSPRGDAAQRDCENAGGSTQQCERARQDALQQCYVETLPLVTSVEVELVDETGLLSQMVEVALGDTPQAAIGEECDPLGATGSCPAGAVCWGEDPSAPETCHETGPACPDGYLAGTLVETTAGEVWSWNGDNSNAEAHGRTSCGAGGASDVLEFTAPAAGTYVIGTSDLEPGVDTVLAVRSYCQLPGYELACNDDFSSIGAMSQVRIDLDAGQTIYIVVDSPDGTSVGAYALSVRLEG